MSSYLDTLADLSSEGWFFLLFLGAICLQACWELRLIWRTARRCYRSSSFYPQ